MNCLQVDCDHTTRHEDNILRGDFLKTAIATEALTAALRIQAEQPSDMPDENFADVNGQRIIYSVNGVGKPLVLLHGGSNPDSYGAIWLNWSRTVR